MAEPIPRAFTLPGWQGSGPGHWQSRWEPLHGFERVEQDDWIWPRRGDWMARLEEVLLTSQYHPVVLVAHSLGCHLVAAWAAHSSNAAARGRVKAALLVAPPDLERTDLPPNLFAWRPVVVERLPFPSIAVLSHDDPFAALAPSRALAARWGSETIEIGARGHVNAESGLADWPEGYALVRRLWACVP